MVWYIVISLVVGVVLWYVWFHYRYQDTRTIDQMRTSLRKAQDQLEQWTLSEKELAAQNTILKKKTEQLLIQNEDYSKMISKLSRYYFHIKEANTKIDELKKTLQVFDDDIEKQLSTSWSLTLTDSVKWPIDLTPKTWLETKFF